MPPKPKVTKEEVAAAALTIIKEQGVEALTARNLGNRLGTSARPIFTAFKNMEDLQQKVRRAAMERDERYVKKAMFLFSSRSVCSRFCWQRKNRSCTSSCLWTGTEKRVALMRR